ncbi:MAG TPA: cytochrome b5-like heme/steroid binding domain-containing protein [bacterium]|nr:cytochrome b5-like heme/steroid binding domain-containing protein [bacterium]
MKNKTLITLLISGFFVLSLSACSNKNDQPINTNLNSTSSNSDIIAEESYTLADVKQHSSRSDCWTIIDGQVYDLSAYIASGQHNPKIVDGCGIDSTDMFNNVSKHANEKSQNLLFSMIIGNLAQ